RHLHSSPTRRSSDLDSRIRCQRRIRIVHPILVVRRVFLAVRPSEARLQQALTPILRKLEIDRKPTLVRRLTRRQREKPQLVTPRSEEHTSELQSREN